MAVLGGYLAALASAIQSATAALQLEAPGGKRAPYIFVGDLPYRRQSDDSLAPYISILETTWEMDRNERAKANCVIEIVAWLPDARKGEVGQVSALADYYAMVRAVVQALRDRLYRDSGWIVTDNQHITGMTGLSGDNIGQPWPFVVGRVMVELQGV